MTDPEAITTLKGSQDEARERMHGGFGGPNPYPRLIDALDVAMKVIKVREQAVKLIGIARRHCDRIQCDGKARDASELLSEALELLEIDP